jgi:hypothetical protein
VFVFESYQRIMKDLLACGRVQYRVGATVMDRSGNLESLR